MNLKDFITRTCEEVVAGAQATDRTYLKEPIFIEFDIPIPDTIGTCNVKFTLKIDPGKVKGDD